MHPRCFLTLAALVTLLGCGTTHAPIEPAAVQAAAPVPAPPAAAAPRLERISLVEHGTSELLAPQVSLDSLYVGDAENRGRADLRVGADFVTLSLPGCAQGAGYGWAVEHADRGPAPWARFVRSPVLPATDGADQAAHVVGITGAIAAFGQRVTPQRIELRDGGAVLFAFTASHPAVGEGSPQPHEQLLMPGVSAEQALGEHVLELALAEGQSLGCPMVSLTLLDPRTQLVDVVDGGVATVRRLSRLRLGRFTIRWKGHAFASLRGGGGRVLLEFEGSVDGASDEPFTCSGVQRCTFHELVIELVELGARSTFRLSLARAEAPPRAP